MKKLDRKLSKEDTVEDTTQRWSVPASERGCLKFTALFQSSRTCTGWAHYKLPWSVCTRARHERARIAHESVCLYRTVSRPYQYPS